MASWDDLKRGKQNHDAPPDEYAVACAAVFTTPAGRQLMDLLHSRYIDAVLTGLPDERALVNLNAKRQLVWELDEMTARGLAALKKEKTA